VSYRRPHPVSVVHFTVLKTAPLSFLPTAVLTTEPPSHSNATFPWFHLAEMALRLAAVATGRVVRCSAARLQTAAAMASTATTAHVHRTGDVSSPPTAAVTGARFKSALPETGEAMAAALVSATHIFFDVWNHTRRSRSTCRA
jgi:hypothetical protein